MDGCGREKRGFTGKIKGPGEGWSSDDINIQILGIFGLGREEKETYPEQWKFLHPSVTGISFSGSWN